MKKALLLGALIFASVLFAGCQSAQTSTNTTPKNTAPASAAPAQANNDNPEITAIENELKELDQKQDFPSFTEADLQ